MADETIGQYEVVRPLATGGFADTFLVRRSDAGGGNPTVCLKMMLPKLALKKQARDEFAEEVRLMKRLRHTQVVRFIEANLAAARPWFVMEYIDGVDLRGVLAELRHSASTTDRIPLAMHLVADLCSPLAYIHEARDDAGTPLQVVHRDLNPNNVLIASDGCVKLADFGISKYATRAKVTETGYWKGHAAYMSPEHFDPSKVLDARSDLFALGIVFYELLTGQLPFPGPTAPVAMAAMTKGDYPALEVACPEAPKALADLVRRLLDPDKEGRPQTAREVRRELHRIPGFPIDGRDQLEALLPLARQRREAEETLEAADDVIEAAEQELGGVVTRAEPRGRTDDARTGEEPVSPSRTPPPHSSRPRASRQRWVILAAAASGLVVLWSYRGGPSSTDRPQPDGPAKVASTTRAPVLEPQQAPALAAPTAPTAKPTADASIPLPDVQETPAKTAKQAVAAATLNVDISPWGILFVDGKQIGPGGFQTVMLKPGKHKLEVRDQESGRTRSRETIRLRAGEIIAKALKSSDL